MTGNELDAIETPLDAIDQAWQELFEERLQGRRGRFASNRNILFLASGKTDQQLLENYVELFSEVHAGRFFIIQASEQQQQLCSFTTLASHETKKGGVVFCPIVQVKTPSDRPEPLLSFLRHYRIPGVALDLVLVDPQIRWELIRTLSQEAEQLLFCSEQFSDQIGALQEILNTGCRKVDSSWIAIRDWRQAVKLLFYRKRLAELIDSIECVEVEYSVRKEGEICLTALLLAGWLLDCLGLSLQAAGAKEIECQTPGGKRVSLQLKASVDKTAGVNALRFSFASHTEGLAKQPKHPELFVSLRRRAELEAELHLGETYRLSFAIVEQDHSGCLQRYFSVGESVERYEEALKGALELQSLLRGFRGKG